MGKEGNWELGVRGWAKRGVGSWELGVGEEEIEKLDNYQLSTISSLSSLNLGTMLRSLPSLQTYIKGISQLAEINCFRVPSRRVSHLF
uniref:Uncharacterized protein n=1 Tax=Desertifilum tharense IPPAS B-1220 TaxID=1781255 RepID=A0ACD5GP67_9CYAN